MARILLNIKRGTVLFRHLRSRTSSVVNYPAFMAGFFLWVRGYSTTRISKLGGCWICFLTAHNSMDLRMLARYLSGKPAGKRKR